MLDFSRCILCRSNFLEEAFFDVISSLLFIDSRLSTLLYSVKKRVIFSNEWPPWVIFAIISSLDLRPSPAKGHFSSKGKYTIVPSELSTKADLRINTIICTRSQRLIHWCISAATACITVGLSVQASRTAYWDKHKGAQNSRVERVKQITVWKATYIFVEQPWDRKGDLRWNWFLPR